MKKPVALCILDGWGSFPDPTGNAPQQAYTPTFDYLVKNFPTAELITHGPDAGLPRGQMGNSEVGHTNIGAGRVVAMDLGQIDLAIENGAYSKNDHILRFIDKLSKSGGCAHMMALLSDGGVHGHIKHLIETLQIFAETNLSVKLHLITDGRDVGPKTAAEYWQQLESRLPANATVASVCGRYFALDRDNRWDRVEQAYNAIVHAKGVIATGVPDIISGAYNTGTTDEFVPCTVLAGYTGMTHADGLFCLNFRADRAREILSALGDRDFSAFNVDHDKNPSHMLGMVSYSSEHDKYMDTVFPKRDIQNTLGEWVSQNGMTQFRLAETEKYPHVTFFLNGGREQPFPGEARFMPASPKVATYDLQPEMSADEVTRKFVDAIVEGYDLIVTNYANPDMVGHTGDIAAAIAACEAVDRGLSKVLSAITDAGGSMIVTADHGNCEVMVDPETGGPHTAHTTNPVPIILVSNDRNITLRNGRLADIAPTLLKLMNLEKPAEMTGESLIV